jgi:hypothetical protein
MPADFRRKSRGMAPLVYLATQTKRNIDDIVQGEQYLANEDWMASTKECIQLLAERYALAKEAENLLSLPIGGDNGALISLRTALPMAS